MQICIFEDNNAGNFEPLSFYRPVFELVCGINTLREKILRYYPGSNHSVYCRDYLADIMRERYPGLLVNEIVEDDYLFINGAILADEDLAVQISDRKDDIVFMSGGVLAAAKLSYEKVKTLKFSWMLNLSELAGLKTENIKVTLMEYVFDLIKNNKEQMTKDFEYMNKKRKSLNSEFTGVHLLEKDQIIIQEGAVLKPGVVLDASEGPILIGRNSIIFPNSVIEGPVSIGESSLIKSCSTIYSNVTIGKVCKVGGELEDTVILDYSNKQHSGFLGHAYLGSWVNLGADTNCSDLKNNYSSIRITLDGKEINSGMQFLGLLMGDHSKTAINTMFNTGTVAGFSSNIFGAGFPVKYIPSFSWGGSSGIIEYDVEKSIITAKKVMERRKVSFTPAEDKLFRNIFIMTGKNRLKETVH